jgi:uncharacterized membrane protein
MYDWLKLVHVLAVIMFIGNIVTGVFWHKHALRTQNAQLIAHTVDGIIRSDRLFTMPGVTLILVSGISAAVSVGFPVLRTGWIVWTIVMFAVSGLVFMLRLAPLQRAMLAMAQSGAKGGNFDFAAYHRLSSTWDFWGALATVTPIIGVGLMVLKPDF